MRTPYDILGVPRSASEETIKTAFHRAAKAHHPDLNAGDPTAEQKLRQVLAAYHILKGPEERAAYDLQLRNHRRTVARRFAGASLAGLASGGVVALAVYLSVSPSHKQVASAPAASLAMEWERVEASRDPKAIWAFAVRNPQAPQSELARSRLIELIETADDVPMLNVLRLVASHAVAERARERLVRLGALATKEDIVASSSSDVLASVAIEVVGREEPAEQEPVRVTAKVAVREEPAVQHPERVTTQVVAVRQEPALHELKGEMKRALDREEPAARKHTRMPGTAPRDLAKGHDAVRSVAAENRSSGPMFGVGF
jgi:curved DNA-binding protein CbpA